MRIEGQQKRGRANKSAAQASRQQKYDAFLEALHSTESVSGLTHNFYRYPARFSPEFVREAINLWTEPGDVVFDPFMGGGTTAVEALGSGRKFIGCDISTLSSFLARVKTTPLSQRDIEIIKDWHIALPFKINLQEETPRHTDWKEYQRHVPWWLRKTIEIALDDCEELPRKHLKDFARCSLLRAAQWALDCREIIPSTREFLSHHQHVCKDMLMMAGIFSDKVRETVGALSAVTQHRRLICRSVVGLEGNSGLPKWNAPRLVLTSPPYMGVHVLYHRWQIQGRRETPAPFWIAGKLDGHGGSYYTFADRKNPSGKKYLEKATESFASICTLLDDRSRVVQLVAFSKPKIQLPQYLTALEAAGLQETSLNDSDRLHRIWRSVPHQKWYAKREGGFASGQEILLIHKKAK
jgi:hypothetical protein